MRNYKSGQILPGQGTPLPPKPARGAGDANHAGLRRQQAGFDPVRTIRAKSRPARAQARRGRGFARQSRHHRGHARGLRPGAARAGDALRAAAQWRRYRCRAMSTARSGRRWRKARCSTATPPTRGRISPTSRCASARCARAPPDRTPISARSSAIRWCSAPAPPAPARPGLRSPMRCRCSSARRSTASSCRGRRWKPASGSAFCRATCARRSIPICARSTTRCST